MASPPCLPPVSGVLVVTNPRVVKPVAFRAVQQQRSSTPGSIVDELSSSMINSPDSTGASGYHSAPLQTMRQSAHHNSVLKIISFHRYMPHFSSHSSNKSDRVEHDSGHSSALLITTPLSAELEAQLRGKDAEIARLRQTLQENERAIIDVYQEKEENWRLEMENLRKHYERLLRPQEHCISPKDHKLDQEKELDGLMEDANIVDNPKHLREALYQCRQELDNMLQAFRKERSCWLKEKAKVLHYQRKLELSYWQICNHNQELLKSVASVPLQALDGWYNSESTC